MVLEQLPLDIREAIVDRLLQSFQNLVVDGVQNLIFSDEILRGMLSLGVIEIERREVGDVYLFTKEVQDLLLDIIVDVLGGDQ